MSKKTYIYFTPKELNEKFELALIEIKKKVAIHKQKIKKFNNINESKVYDGNFIVSENQVINGKFKENVIPEIINGKFDCKFLELTSLVGSPEIVEGYFNCSNNFLTSLVGSPEIIKDFYCYNNNLTSLVGSPEIVEGDFNCGSNSLTSLVGCPEIVGINFYCYSNPLTSLYGIPKNVKYVYCGDNLRIERDFINSGSYKNDYWLDLLNYCIKNNENLDEINWPENFLNSNLKKSSKGINKFNI